MASADRIKEEIGWLKLVFGALVAVDMTLVGWIVQNFRNAESPILVLASAMTLLFSAGIIWCNVHAYRLLCSLEES